MKDNVQLQSKINRYELEFEPTLNYFRSSLEGTNTLSSQLMAFVDFKLGHFFTFLPKNMGKKELHEFRYGGKSKVVQSRDFIIHFILDKLHSHDNMVCFFDNFNDTFSPAYDDPLYSACGMNYGEEVYYSIPQKLASPHLIEDCLYVSNTLWHSLCILSEVNLDNQLNDKLNLEQINNICLGTQFIIIIAYDAEGYVIWEKTNRRLSY